MNLVLWAVQIILAIKLLSAAYSHGLRPDYAKMQRGLARFGAGTRPLLFVIAVAALLGAAALIIPGALDVYAGLTAWAAAAITVAMLLAIAFHVRCRKKANAPVSLVLAALAAFVAYGRWVLAPF
jgi:hypothetical protein